MAGQRTLPINETTALQRRSSLATVVPAQATKSSPSRRISLTQGIRDLGRSVSIKLQPRQRRISRKEKCPTPSPPSSTSGGIDRGYGSKGSSAETLPLDDASCSNSAVPQLPPTPERSILKSSASSSSAVLPRRGGWSVMVSEKEAEIIGENGGLEWYQRGFGPEMRCNSISDYLDFVSLEAAASPSSEDVQWVNSPLRRVSSYERFMRSYGEYVDLLPPASQAPTNGTRYRWISLKRVILRRK